MHSTIVKTQLHMYEVGKGIAKFANVFKPSFAIRVDYCHYLISMASIVVLSHSDLYVSANRFMLFTSCFTSPLGRGCSSRLAITCRHYILGTTLIVLYGAFSTTPYTTPHLAIHLSTCERKLSSYVYMFISIDIYMRFRLFKYLHFI